MSELKVMVCDDQPGMRLVLRKLIEKAEGFRLVGEAESGEACLELFAELRPEIVFMDVEMPGINGVECARRIQDIDPKTALIFATAHEGYMGEAFELYAFDYLLKPFRDQELTHAVARVCRKMESAPAANTPAVKKEPEATGYVRQAMDYIAGHYADENISIATIAGHLCVSEGHLSHVFKKQTGMTVTNYLTKTRIDAAMALLQTGRVKVYEAAAAVGYKDVTYFSATFKKLTGLSPSEVE